MQSQMDLYLDDHVDENPLITMASMCPVFDHRYDGLFK